MAGGFSENTVAALMAEARAWPPRRKQPQGRHAAGDVQVFVGDEPPTLILMGAPCVGAERGDGPLCGTTYSSPSVPRSCLSFMGCTRRRAER